MKLKQSIVIKSRLLIEVTYRAFKRPICNFIHSLMKEVFIMNDAYNEYMYEKTDKSIDDYPKKDIILADLLRITDGKTHVCIIDRETEEVLYNDRAEYITWTTEGCCSSLCSKKVEYLDSIDGAIEVHLNMKEYEPIPCHTSGHSKIDDLIGANGNWYLEFRYNRHGSNILFLLPSFCVDDDEEKKNNYVVDMADGLFEESVILQNFIKEHPNTPFIISEHCFDKCVEVLKERLDGLIDYSNKYPYDKFQVECDEFAKFMTAVFNILSSEEPEATIYNAAYYGWEKYINS